MRLAVLSVTIAFAAMLLGIGAAARYQPDPLLLPLLLLLGIALAILREAC